ncbi:MAG: rod-binding protein [Gemmatimonadales bacterium]
MIPSTSVPAAAPTGDARTDKIAKLKNTAKQLEGVFVQQLFKAMRETVSQDGAVEGGAGEEMFTSLSDEKLASRVPNQWQHSLSDTIVSRLQGRIAPEKP